MYFKDHNPDPDRDASQKDQKPHGFMMTIE